MADEKSERGFAVVDRRVTAEDESAVSKMEPPLIKEGAGKAEAGKTETGPETGADDDGVKSAAPPVSFPTFLLSLHASALFHLGMLSGPEAGEKKVDLEAARQNIDLLEVLKDKTRGNLAPEEEQLLENILYELRLLYVQACRGTGKECKE